jgi:hypothetical protein
MYGGYCAASLESPFSLSTRSKNLSNVVLLTCPPDIFLSDTGKMSSAICYRTLEVYSVGSLTGVDTYSVKGQSASMMEDSIAVHDLVAGCGVFGMKGGSCVKTHGWPTMYCGDCNTVSTKDSTHDLNSRGEKLSPRVFNSNMLLVGYILI